MDQYPPLHVMDKPHASGKYAVRKEFAQNLHLRVLTMHIFGWGAHSDRKRIRKEYPVGNPQGGPYKRFPEH